ncbi:MAG: hypothetical protein JXR48_09655 [Candidatus Delongbacteria bacterium]|nr:hypothetical protein [Candidatus Delongbacteria bacterium]
MIFKCKCKKPPFHYLDYDIVVLGENNLGEATLQTCKKCGAIWLKFLIEEPHYTNSGRWWRVQVSPNEMVSLTIDSAINYIEIQSECFVGGSFYKQGIHKKYKPICVK